ncbi:MAG: methyltransferase domain-containing protein [Candidatus Omnitrophica bacterium]|nr:methyltransferase domain-containing protein [Candidatus Omnitrophota bacterium]
MNIEELIIMKSLPECEYNYSTATDPFEEELRRISYSDIIEKRPEKIVLVVPASPQVPTPGREFLVTGPFEGFTYMATLVKKMGFDLEVVDCRLKDDPEKLVMEASSGADAIGLGAFCDSFDFLRKVTREIKKKYPQKTVFLGGPLVSSLPEIMMDNTSADLGIIGEAELTMIELLTAQFSAEERDPSGIKGIVYRKNGKIAMTAPRPQIKDLDNLPLLDYTIWPNCRDILKNGQILISSMRGCPMDCSFCFKTIPALRMKSLERFEAEVEYLKRTTGFNYTWLNDLTFNVKEDRAIKICRILHRHGVRYHCFARVKNVSREFTRVLKETGCLGIWFGIESYDQDVLDANRKGITIGDINNAVKVSGEAGLEARGLFIVGLYGETEESLKKMLGYIKNSSFLPLVKYLVPFPGTSLYHHAVGTGKIPDAVRFLEMLSKRKIRDFDDEIINLTDLPDDTMRRYFHEIWKITADREKGAECGTGENPEDHFRKRAGKYDNSSSWVDDPALIRKIYDMSGAGKGSIVLDVAIGTGKVAGVFHDNGSRVIGIDISPGMVDHAGKFADWIIMARAEAMPFKNGFDVCTCRQGLQFMDVPAALGEISRVLKPGGRVVLSHLTAYDREDGATAFHIQRLRNPARKNYFLPGDLGASLSSAGFTDVVAEEYITRESVNKWIDNGAISAGAMAEIKEVYRTAPARFRELHRIEFAGDDIFDSMKMEIVRAVKPY